MFQFIWNEWLDGDIDIIHKFIVNDLNRFYKDVPSIEKIDYVGFRDFAINYCKYLSEIVSEKGGILVGDIVDFVDNYFN